MLQDIVNSFSLGSIYLLFAIGLALTWGTIGILNFAHGAVFMFSAFVAHLVAEAVALPAPLLVVVAGITGAILSVAIQLLAFDPIMRRARSQHAGEMQVLIGGIGIASVPVALVQAQTTSGQFSLGSSSTGDAVFSVAGVQLTGTMLAVMVLAVTISVAMVVWLERSRHGLALRTIANDPETASLMGVNRSRLALGTMAVAGMLAGIAGAMLTLYLVGLTPQSGDVFLIKAFAVIILGGVGSIPGVILGCYLLAFLETFFILQGWGSWATAVAFGLIFVVLLLRPQGLFGRVEVRRT